MAAYQNNGHNMNMATHESTPLVDEMKHEMKMPTPSSSSPTDRRMSNEWDASKVPPSRFQKRKGSIFAVQASRDGLVDRNYAAAFYAKHEEKGYHMTK